jgi:hypothetical protein
MSGSICRIGIAPVAAVALLLRLASVTGQELPDDPIAKRLARQEKAFSTAVVKSKSTLIAAIGRQHDGISRNKKMAIADQIKLLKQVEAEKEAFEKKGTLPTLRVLQDEVRSYRSSPAKPIDAWQEACDKAAKAYKSAGDLKKAEAVLVRGNQILRKELGPLGTASPPADARPFNRSRYKAFAERLTWKQAKAKCEEPGGHLAIVRNPIEQQFIHTIAIEAGLRAAWLGATDEAEEGHWRWVDDSELRFQAWGQDQPNNKGFGGEPEHYLITVTEQGGWWWDASDDARMRHFQAGFVCQWDIW